MKQVFWVVVKLRKHLVRISAQSLEIKGVSLSHAADWSVCRCPEREEQKNKTRGGSKARETREWCGRQPGGELWSPFWRDTRKRQQHLLKVRRWRAGEGPAPLRSRTQDHNLCWVSPRHSPNTAPRRWHTEAPVLCSRVTQHLPAPCPVS